MSRCRWSIRSFLKELFNFISLVLVSPASIMCWIEKRVSKNGEECFQFWTHIFALLPGLPGLFLRRAFYRTTLVKCSKHCYIGFGALFTHRLVEVEDGVYVGPYCLIGRAHLKAGSLIGSRVSIISGKYQHELDENGHWTPCIESKLKQIQVGPDAWIGEGAVVMADVGQCSLVAAGAVVGFPVPVGIVVAGNPARYVRKIWENGKDKTCEPST